MEIHNSYADEIKTLMLEISNHQLTLGKTGGVSSPVVSEFSFNLLQNAPNPILIQAPDSSIIFVNPAMEYLTGYSYQELVGQIIPYPYWPKEKTEEYLEAFQKRSSNNAHHTSPKLFNKKDGSQFWVQSSLALVKDSLVNLNYYISVWQDITEQKRIQRDLEESENFSSSILSNSPNPIAVINPDSKITYINPAFEKLTGYTPQELIGVSSPYPFWLEKDIKVNLTIIKEKWGKKGTHYSENSFRTKKGEYIVVHITGTPIKDSYGDVQRYVINWVDITKRQKIEKDLRDSEEFSTSLLNNAPNPIIVSNADTSIKYVNPAFETLTGFSRDELIGKKIPYPWWPERVFQECRGFNAEFICGEVHNAERCGQKKDGTPFWISLNRNVVRENGEAKYFLGNWVDITERKKSEDEIKHQAMLVDNVSDAIISTDLKSYIVSWNKAAEKIFGWRKEEVTGKRIREIIGLGFDFGNPEESQKLLNEMVNQVYTNGSWRGEQINLRRTGERVNFAATVSLVFDSSGKRIGVVGIYSDITERKNTEAQIRLNEARLESLLRITQFKEQTIQNLLDYALTEAIQLTNSKMGYIYNYDEERQEFALNTLSMGNSKECAITNPDTTHLLKNAGLWGEAVRQRKPIMINDFQAPNPLKKGYPPTHVEIQRFLTIPIMVNNRIVAVVGVANKSEDYDQSDLRQLTLLMDSVWEIIERRKAIEELKMAAEGLEVLYEKEKSQREELQEEAKARGLFIDVLAHELRSPLTPILASSGMLHDLLNSSTDSIQKRLSANICQGAETIAHRLEELLDLARYSRGGFKLNLQSTNMGKYIEEMVSRFKPGLLQRNQQLILELSQDLQFAQIDQSR
jgi:PAS domain S-box-containing protein